VYLEEAPHKGFLVAPLGPGGLSLFGLPALLLAAKLLLGLALRLVVVGHRSFGHRRLLPLLLLFLLLLLLLLVLLVLLPFLLEHEADERTYLGQGHALLLFLLLLLDLERRTLRRATRR
jgi:hypothetical protein